MALKEEELVGLLETFNNHLHLSGPFSHFFREVGWLINRGLLVVSDATEKLLNAVFSLADFIGSKKITGFITEWRTLIFAIGTIGLILFCYRYMRDKNVSKQNFFDNLILGMSVALVLSTVLVTLTGVAFGTANLIRSDGETSGQSVVKSNITDLLQYDDNNWTTEKLKDTNNIPSDNIKYIKINEQLKAKDKRLTSDKSKELLKVKINVGADGKTVSEKNEKGVFKWDEHYYRYSWHPWVIAFTLIMTIFVNVLTSFKYLKIIYELAFNQIIAVFFSLQNLTDASKLNKILQAIGNLLTAVVLMALSLRVYYEFTAYVTSQNLGAVTTLFITIGLGLAVIDGPAIIQELTGVDGGVKSTAMGAIGMGAAAFGMSKLAKSGIDLGKQAASKVGGYAEKAGRTGLELAAAGVGVGKGLASSNSNLESAMSSKNSGESKQSSLEDDMATSEKPSDNHSLDANDQDSGLTSSDSLETGLSNESVGEETESLESQIAASSDEQSQADRLADTLPDGTNRLENGSLEKDMTADSGQPSIENDMAEGTGQTSLETDQRDTGKSEAGSLTKDMDKQRNHLAAGPSPLNQSKDNSVMKLTPSNSGGSQTKEGLQESSTRPAVPMSQQGGTASARPLSQDMMNQARPGQIGSHSQAALNGSPQQDSHLSKPLSVSYPASFNRQSANEQMALALADKPLSPPTSQTIPQAMASGVTNKVTEVQVAYSNRVSESKTLENASRNHQLGENSGKKVRQWIGRRGKK